jgi:hypothetical protein
LSSTATRDGLETFGLFADDGIPEPLELRLART